MVNKAYKVDPLLNIIEYAFMIITALQCNSIYLYFNRSYISKTSANILWQIALIILIIIYINEHRLINSIKFMNLIEFSTIFFIIMGLLIFYNFIVYPSFPKNYIIKLIIDPILLLMCFCFMDRLRTINKLFIDFENVILWMSAISIPLLLFYILGIPTTSVKFSKWGASQLEYGYFDLSFFAKESESTLLGMQWVRNSAMFTEPSMFAYVITIALLIELFVRKDTKLFNYRICLLLITVITTSSTTGIIISFLAYIYYVFTNSNKYSYFRYLLIILTPLFLIILNIIFTEKLSTGMNDSSIRFDDIRAGFKAWKYHILFGNGLGNNDLIKRNMSLWRFFYSAKPSESAGLPTILAQGGIIWGLFYILPTCLIAKYSSKFLGLAIFTSIIFIFVASQGFYIYIMLLCYFWYIIVNYGKSQHIFRSLNING